MTAACGFAIGPQASRNRQRASRLHGAESKIAQE